MAVINDKISGVHAKIPSVQCAKLKTVPSALKCAYMLDK